MSLNTLLLFAIPSALAIFKLAALSLAVVWSVRALVGTHRPRATEIRESLPVPARNTRA